ncbi:uncharacterized protein [Pyxicephalus adspersus]|uniref:uncharacterized protein n=1 Tax=Pyxicephalus adspersus TaxID=30357 RepID=UPI003B595FB7
MDSSDVLWGLTFIFPAVFITALCIGCRRKVPVHIPETGHYIEKDHLNYPPSTSFKIIKGPSVLPRSSTSQTCLSPQEMSLTVPRSPIPPDSRRSSVGREIKAFQVCSETVPISPVFSLSKSHDEDDEDHEYDDYPNYSNDSNRAYIDVLPDDGCAKPVEVESPSVLANRESLSSAIYVNVEDPTESKEARDDHNYVNVGDSKESLEYVNVDEAAKSSSFPHGGEF